MAKETRFERLLREGRGMTAAQREEGVRWLLMQEQAAALLGWLEGMKQAYVDTGCDQALADSHGKQSHGWGSVDALRVAMEGLRGLEGRKRKGGDGDGGGGGGEGN